MQDSCNLIIGFALVYPDNSHENYSYDEVGNLATYTTRAGQVKTSTYDNRNRETAYSWSDATPAVTKTYDAAGRMLTLNSSVSALSYTYDDANQLLSETQDIDGGPGAKTIGYAYDDDGNRSSVTYPSGDVIEYAFTARKQMASIAVNGAEPLASYSYDPSGNRASKLLENGTVADYSYDDANRLLTVDNEANGASFAKFDYAYNSVGNRTARQSTIADQLSTDVYGYDAIDQVTQVKYNFDSNNTQDRQVDYAYDPVGNRTAVTDNGAALSYTANNLNQYTAVGADSPTYDANGNLTAASTSWTYTYDAQNRLVRASQGSLEWDFVYDGRNRCVSRTRTRHGPPGPTYTTTTYFYYDGWNLIEEYNGGAALVARYIHGPQTDELLQRASDRSTTYYHYDALGSTVALTDSDGNVVEQYTYDIYGAPYDGADSGNRFLFTGREYIFELALYDYRNRVYSPELGRFLQTDLISFAGRDINLYRYVSNSPIGYTDSYGTIAVVDDVVEAMVIAAAAAAVAEFLSSPAGQKALHDAGDALKKLWEEPERLKLCTYECPDGSTPTQSVAQSQPCPTMRTIDPDTGCYGDCTVTGEIPYP